MKVLISFSVFFISFVLSGILHCILKSDKMEDRLRTFVNFLLLLSLVALTVSLTLLFVL